MTAAMADFAMLVDESVNTGLKNINTYLGRVNKPRWTCQKYNHSWNCWINDWRRWMLPCDTHRMGYLLMCGKLLLSPEACINAGNDDSPLSEKIEKKNVIAIPTYAWNMFEQVVFCPSRVSKPRAIGVRSKFSLCKSSWNLRLSDPGIIYFQRAFVCSDHISIFFWYKV